MGKSKYSPALDGLPARISGHWAQEKLHYIGRYNQIVAGGMKNKWAARAYLDLLAGGGRCILEDGQEFDGSPLVALKANPPFDNAIFVEDTPELCAALHSRVAAAQGSPVPIILPGDCNALDTREEILKNLPSDALTVAFADMLGADVAFDTVRHLSNARRIDWLVTFQVGHLQRFATTAFESGDGSQQLDDFFGSGAWRDVVEACLLRNRSGGDIAFALAEFYGQCLAGLGYGHVVQLHTLMRNTKGAPLYRLIMASKHPRAAEFFKKVTQVSYVGERLLPF